MSARFAFFYTFKSLLASLTTFMCATLSGLQPGSVPRQTAVLSEAYKETYTEVQKEKWRV